MARLELNGQWGLHKDWENNIISAQVPGSVFHDLMNNHMMEDPYYRDNEKYARELSFHDYTYEREFDISEEFLSTERILICFEGLDTLAEITINDKLIGKTNNMFRYYEFDVKEILKLGVNKIAVHFPSAAKFAAKAQHEHPLFQFDMTMPGMGHIRKGHYMLGWDWGPQLPDIGIYRPVYLESFQWNRFTDIMIHQNHLEHQVDLTFDCQLEHTIDETCNIKIKITDPKGSTTQYTSPNAIITILLDNPMLWWPNGYGDQNLYQLEVLLSNRVQILERKQYQIGLRTMELIQEDDQWGTSFCIKVNNIPIFLKGADYIPEDNILPRCNKERTKRLLQDCTEANHNAIRVWGGGIYPEEYFYDLCDELGLIVWQDLMFACGTYDSDNAEFMETTLEEIKYNITRIRHRACLGLICGNNEMELAHVEWELPDRENNKTRYLHLFEEELPALAMKIAPEVAYWLASPTSGGKFDNPNDESRGDMHYWGVWHAREPFTSYRKINPRMMSEFGIQSFPNIKTLKSCTEKEDRNIFSRIMELHQRAGSEGNGLILHYISQLYRYPKDFTSLLYVSQMVQAEGLRYGVEHFRRIYGRCMGTIYWQLNDCWPVASWSGIDSCGRWKALHYFSKKFFAPVIVSVEDQDKKMKVVVTNDSKRERYFSLSWKLMNFNGSAVKEESIEIKVEPCLAKEIAKLDFTADITEEEQERNHLVYFQLKEGKEIISTNIVYFVPVKYMELKNTDIQIEIMEREADYICSISTDQLVKGLFLDFKKYDFVLSDNFFDVIPGIKKEITLSKSRTKGILGEDGVSCLKEQLLLTSIVDTY